MKILSFECIGNLKELNDSMLLDSGTTVATLVCEENGKQMKVSLEVRGEVCVEYKDKLYYKPSEFPKELIQIIKTVQYWDCEPCLYVHKHNWFEYVFNGDKAAFPSGWIIENNLHQMTENRLKAKMFNYAKWDEDMM